MKNLSFLHAAKTALLFLLIAGLTISCDNSTGNDDDEQEPVGLRVKQFDNNINGATVVEVSGGVVAGSIDITTGTTSQFIVVFLDEDGEEFQPEIEEHSVDFTVASGQSNASVAVPFSDVEPYTFQVTGNNVGSSLLIITLLHEGAAEFLTPDITIQVSEN